MLARYWYELLIFSPSSALRRYVASIKIKMALVQESLDLQVSCRSAGIECEAEIISIRGQSPARKHLIEIQQIQQKLQRKDRKVSDGVLLQSMAFCGCRAILPGTLTRKSLKAISLPESGIPGYPSLNSFCTVDSQKHLRCCSKSGR